MTDDVLCGYARKLYGYGLFASLLVASFSLVFSSVWLLASASFLAAVTGGTAAFIHTYCADHAAAGASTADLQVTP